VKGVHERRSVGDQGFVAATAVATSIVLTMPTW
jgi:hypothetical protein